MHQHKPHNLCLVPYEKPYLDAWRERQYNRGNATRDDLAFMPPYSAGVITQQPPPPRPQQRTIGSQYHQPACDPWIDQSSQAQPQPYSPQPQARPLYSPQAQPRQVTEPQQPQPRQPQPRQPRQPGQPQPRQPQARKPQMQSTGTQTRENLMLGTGERQPVNITEYVYEDSEPVNAQPAAMAGPVEKPQPRYQEHTHRHHDHHPVAGPAGQGSRSCSPELYCWPPYPIDASSDRPLTARCPVHERAPANLAASLGYGASHPGYYRYTRGGW